MFLCSIIAWFKLDCKCLSGEASAPCVFVSVRFR